MTGMASWMLDEAREKGKQEAGNGVTKEMAMESIQTGVTCRLIKSNCVNRGVNLPILIYNGERSANFQPC